MLLNTDLHNTNLQLRKMSPKVKLFNTLFKFQGTELEQMMQLPVSVSVFISFKFCYSLLVFPGFVNCEYIYISGKKNYLRE